MLRGGFEVFGDLGGEGFGVWEVIAEPGGVVSVRRYARCLEVGRAEGLYSRFPRLAREATVFRGEGERVVLGGCQVGCVVVGEVVAACVG